MAVILVHATENLYVMNVEHLNVMSEVSRLFALTFFTLGRIGVPLFLFLSGYLLLDRFYDEDGCRRFWKRNWCGLVLTTEIWIVLYDAFLWSVYGTQPSLWKHVLFLQQVPMGHMWYMPMIIGLYLFLPFTARALHDIDAKILRFPLVILSIYLFAVPVFQIARKALGHGWAWSILDPGYSGGVYGVYLLLGYCVKKGMLKCFNDFQVMGMGCFFFLATLSLELFSYSRGETYNVWYNCGFLLLCALFLFEGFSRIKISGERHWLSWLSRQSFGLYLIHFLLMKPGADWLRTVPLLMPVKVILLFVGVLVISMALCYMIAKSPKLGRWLLYNR